MGCIPYSTITCCQRACLTIHPPLPPTNKLTNNSINRRRNPSLHCYKNRTQILSFSSNSEGERRAAKKRSFLASARRAEVKLPGVAVRVTASEALDDKRILDFIDSIVSENAASIIIVEGEARLYEAACLLKEKIKDRAYLLVSHRVDIAAAAGASGVVLSDQDLPAIIARNMLETARSDSTVVPLVARAVKSFISAQSASIGEGADLLLLDVDQTDEIQMLLDNQFQTVSTPVFVIFDLPNQYLIGGQAYMLLKSGASGLVVSASKGIHLKHNIVKEIKLLLSSMDLSVANQAKSFSINEANNISKSNRESRNILDKPIKEILEEERLLLFKAISVLREAAPKMEEISLLVDAVSQLDDLFLLVIVGEFNSGKSTLINAMLGEEFLKVGVVPTTNEITLLCYSDANREGTERDRRHPDGHFIKYLPAKLLKQLTLVDTPGTNVILKRQQKLTEEFVPRADLVLFVISADRPLSESEVAFLYYIRQWGKKIVFILNKSDIFKDPDEKQEAITFVKDNASRLLGIEHITLYPISAHQAMEAKRAATGNDGKLDPHILVTNPNWDSSGFSQLEDFIFSFLDSATSRGAERTRLKLQTPVGIANALLAAIEEQVIAECAKAKADIMTIEENLEKLSQYQQMMFNESIPKRTSIYSVIDEASKRAEVFVDSILQISNVEVASKYLLRSDQTGSASIRNSFQTEVIGSSLMDMHELLEEYWSWLTSNNVVQERWYKEFFKERWAEVASIDNMEINEVERSKKLIQSCSLKVMQEFNIQAASLLLNQEIREVIIESFGGLGVAGLSASLLTSILPTTAEDLLALVLCSAGGFYGVWKLPGRRVEVKSKIKRIVNSLAQKIEAAMQKDLEMLMNDIKLQVSHISEPYYEAVKSKTRKLDGLLSDIKNLQNSIQSLQRKVQNL